MANFKEHPSIEIPSWLGPEWKDESWHNESCGKMLRSDFGGIEYPCLELYVNYDDVDIRETHYKYILTLLVDDSMVAGNAITLLMCEEADTMQAGIKVAVTMLKAVRLGEVRETSV